MQAPSEHAWGITMNYAATFLIVASAASLLACGKSEEHPAPATQPPADIAQAGTAAVPMAPVIEAPPAEAVPAAQLEASPAQPAAVPAAAPAASATQAAPTTVKAGDTPAPSIPSPNLAHGQQIYRQACAFCHDKGVAGAPKTGDAAAWNPRLAQGMEALYSASLRGKGAMPAKGGNPSLADTDVKAAVDYLVAQSR
jgi:cytochrome c5